MHLSKEKASGVAAVSLLLLLLMNSSALALAAAQRSSSGTGALTHSGLSIVSTTSTNSTSGDNNQGDQNQNETQPQNQSGNDTEAGDQVQNDTSGLQEDQNLTGTNGLEFGLVPASSGINGSGHAELEFEGLNVQVSAEIEHAASNANYTFILTVNGTNHALGTLVTDDEGEGEFESGYNFTTTGTYSIGVSLNLNSSPALVGSPASQIASLTGTSSHEDDQGDNNNSQGQQGDNVVVFPLSQSQSSMITSAQLTNLVGAVTFSKLGAQISSVDRSFSLGAGTLPGNRLLIKVFSSGAVGSRILLIDLARMTLANKGLLMTMDGSRVVQAASLAQVLSASPTGKPSYLAVGTAAGYRLLVSIPGIASHSVSILLAFTNAAQQFFQVSGITMLASMLTIGAAVTAIYSKRKVYSPLW